MEPEATDPIRFDLSAEQRASLASLPTDRSPESDEPVCDRTFTACNSPFTEDD